MKKVFKGVHFQVLASEEFFEVEGVICPSSVV